MPKCSTSSSTLYGIFCAALLLFCALTVLAQSGRRARQPTPAPSVAPEPTPTPAKLAEPKKPAITFVIGMDRFGDFSRLPLYVSSGVLRSCAERLDEPDSVKVDTATRDISRADAVLRAKSEKEAYVVWLQLRPNSMSGRAGSNDDPYDVAIEYAVFAPTTAKQVTSGTTWPAAYRNQRIRLPTTSTSGDYYLNQAAKGAADRILNHFHVGMIIPHLNDY